MLRLCSQVNQVSRPATVSLYGTRKCPACWALRSSSSQATETRDPVAQEYRPVKKLLVANRGQSIHCRSIVFSLILTLWMFITKSYECLFRFCGIYTVLQL